MSHKAWEEAHEWSQFKAYTKIKTLGQLETLKIRELKRLAQEINRDCGLIISKPLSVSLGHVDKKGNPGRVLTEMVKAQLVESICHFKKTLIDRPQTSGEWKFERVGHRLYTFTAPQTDYAWVHYVGFDSEQAAYKQYQYLLENGLCRMAALRQTDRTDFAWEVKYWGLDSTVWAKLQEKDALELQSQKAPAPEPEPEPDPISETIETTLEQLRDRYQGIANGNPALAASMIAKSYADTLRIEDGIVYLIGAESPKQKVDRLTLEIQEASKANGCTAQVTSSFAGVSCQIDLKELNRDGSLKRIRTLGIVSYSDLRDEWSWSNRPNSPSFRKPAASAQEAVEQLFDSCMAL